MRSGAVDTLPGWHSTGLPLLGTHTATPPASRRASGTGGLDSTRAAKGTGETGQLNLLGPLLTTAQLPVDQQAAELNSNFSSVG